MMNVTKRLSAMLAAMIMVFCTPLFVFAAGQTELRDDAELFTSEEETQLQAELDAFAQKTGIELDYHKRLAALDGFETSMQRFFAEGGNH